MGKETMTQRLLSKRKEFEEAEKKAKRAGDMVGVRRAKNKIAEIDQMIKEWGND